MRLENKVALIVGAGEHLGRSVPLLFAQEGANVVITARRPKVLEETAAMIRDKGGHVRHVVGDAAKREDVDRMIAVAVSEFGRLDILYNNIGGGWVEIDRRLHELSDEAYEQIVRSNLVAIFNTCRAAVTQMMRQGGGWVCPSGSSRT